MPASSGTGVYGTVVGNYDLNNSITISSGHTVTLEDHVTNCNYFYIEAGATLVGAGYSITVDNETSSNWSFINAGTISGVLDVVITNPNEVAALGPILTVLVPKLKCLPAQLGPIP